MKRFLSMCAAVIVIAVVSVGSAEASGPFFRFPLLSAIRDNRQARAFNARANLDLARANAFAASAVANQAFVVRAPVVAAPVFASPVYAAPAYFGAPVFAAPVSAYQSFSVARSFCH